METISYSRFNEDILRNMSPPGRRYYVLLALAFAGVLLGASCWAYQIATGLGTAGINLPVFWGTYLINFVLDRKSVV